VAFRNGGPGLMIVEDGRERCGGRLWSGWAGSCRRRRSRRRRPELG